MNGTIPLTTEGRIFARNVIRELKRREPLDASQFAGKPVDRWEEAIFPLADRLFKNGNDPFTRNAVLTMIRRMQAISEPCHTMVDGPDLITLKASEYHTLTVMDGEREQAVIAQRHVFDKGIIGAVVCNISDHALGRFYERVTSPKPTVRNGVLLTLACAQVGAFVSGAKHLVHSEINFSLGHGAIAVGNVKLSTHAGTDWASAWFDCRTILPESACDEKQMEQAMSVNDCLFGRARIADISFLPMRTDYVMQVLDASRRSKN